jgi:hypothetical protein
VLGQAAADLHKKSWDNAHKVRALLTNNPADSRRVGPYQDGGAALRKSFARECGSCSGGDLRRKKRKSSKHLSFRYGLTGQCK